MNTVVVAPPARIATNRIGAQRDRSSIRLFVFHTTEGSEGETSAEQLVAVLGTPGTREVENSNPPRFYGPSYHWGFDTDRVHPLVTDDRVAYAAPGVNHDGVHFVFPGRARQTRAEWLDPISRSCIAQAAALCVLLAPQYDIPLVRLTVAQVVAGERGMCDHKTITDAYHRTDHYDVGPNFPWDVLAADIAALIDQSEEDDMPKYLHVVAQPDGSRPEVLVAFDGAGVEIIPCASPQDLVTLVDALGATRAAVSVAQYDLIVGVDQSND